MPWYNTAHDIVMGEQPGEVTILLHQWRKGIPEAENKLFSLVFPHLLTLAEYRMKRERPGHPLDAGGLVAETYLRLIPAKDRDWRSRRHFYAISARVMRRYLIDEWRKRPKGELVPMRSDLQVHRRDLDLEIEVDRLLEDLSQENPEWCEVVELKHFLGLTDEETAEVMKLTLHTMQRRWRDAREWLFARLEKKNAEQSTGG